MWYIIISALIAIYVLLNLVVPTLTSGFTESYIVRPLLWSTLAILIYLITRREGLNIWQFKKIRRWDIGRTPSEAALLLGGFQISCLLILGLFFGFSQSPYSHTPLAIAINICYITSMLFGIELSRAYLIKKAPTLRNNLTLTIALITFLLMLISIPLLKLTLLPNDPPVELLKFFGETIIPALAMGLFASYLAYLGGALPAIIYMGTIELFYWLTPVLPDSNWALTALISTITPALGFILIQNTIQQTGERKKTRRKHQKDPALPWAGVAIICTLLIFFSFGYLGVQPTVIYSGSMRPNLDVGDIVIITTVPDNTIHIDDIIQYRTTTVPTIHRVHNITHTDNTKLYITKGDANDHPDLEPVYPENIMGKAIFTIPKLGWIPITIKEFIHTLATI